MSKFIAAAGTAFFVAALSAAPARAALVVNGSFEAPGGIIRTFLTPGSLPGWTYNDHGTGADIYEDDTQDGLAAADGSHYVSFGHNGSYGGELSQTIATTAGHSYRLSLSTAEQQGDDPTQQFFVLLTTSVGNTYGFTIGSLTSTFTQTIQDFAPNGVSTTISITDASPAGAGAGSNLALDAVSVVDTTAGAVPEPATWALLLTGFGAVGGAARRRRAAVA